MIWDRSSNWMDAMKSPLECLKDKNIKKIMLYLVRFGKTNVLTLSEKVNIRLRKLKKYLETMNRYAMIYNSYSENDFNDKYLYYEPSKLGIKAMLLDDG